MLGSPPPRNILYTHWGLTLRRSAVSFTVSTFMYFTVCALCSRGVLQALLGRSSDVPSFPVIPCDVAIRWSAPARAIDAGKRRDASPRVSHGDFAGLLACSAGNPTKTRVAPLSVFAVRFLHSFMRPYRPGTRRCRLRRLKASPVAPRPLRARPRNSITQGTPPGAEGPPVFGN